MKKLNNYSKFNRFRVLQPAAFIFVISTFLYSCGLFLSPFNVVSYENFTSLKAFHLKFIDDFTDGLNKTFDQNKIDDIYDMGDLKFREALEYERQKTEDRNRIVAFEILYEQFQADHKFLIDKQRLYKAAYAEEIRGEVETNYNLAIKGELSRRNAPTN